MRNSGINGEGELRGQLANAYWLMLRLEKWPLKQNVCVLSNAQVPNTTIDWW